MKNRGTEELIPCLKPHIYTDRQSDSRAHAFQCRISTFDHLKDYLGFRNIYFFNVCIYFDFEFGSNLDNVGREFFEWKNKGTI